MTSWYMAWARHSQRAEGLVFLSAVKKRPFSSLPKSVRRAPGGCVHLAPWGRLSRSAGAEGRRSDSKRVGALPNSLGGRQDG
eukprot:1091997-Pyramimonas_sp.AAC.1